MSIQMSLLAPTHTGDPASSGEAARRVAPALAGQLAEVYEAICAAGPHGASNRQIQKAVTTPEKAFWNKIPTRCRMLEKLGLVVLVFGDDGKTLYRRDPDSGLTYMVWRAR